MQTLKARPTTPEVSLEDLAYTPFLIRCQYPVLSYKHQDSKT
jgi:hypothetical protein